MGLQRVNILSNWIAMTKKRQLSWHCLNTWGKKWYEWRIIFKKLLCALVWSVSPPTQIHSWNPHQQFLKTWLYLEMQTLKMLGPDPSETHIEEDHGMAQREDASASQGESPQKKPTLLTPWPQASSFQVCWEVNVYCLSPLVCDTLSCPPYQTTDTIWYT